MAINSTIHKVSLDIADMDRHYYHQHELTLAQHPSENNYRFMIRLVAFILNAHERLSFTKGLCADTEPELWQKALTDEIDLWVELGQVDEKRIRRACGRSKQVIIYTYHDGKASVWWGQQGKKLARFKNLKVIQLKAEKLEELAGRTMNLQCSIQDGEVYLSDGELTCTIYQKPH